MRLLLTDPTEGSSEPRRYWTVANTSEACPEVMTPFCWTFWRRINQFQRPAGLVRLRSAPQEPDPDRAGCQRHDVGMFLRSTSDQGRRAPRRPGPGARDVARRRTQQQWELPVTWYGMPDPIEAQSRSEARDLVVDGPGSRGAVVARELGIPCVIGTGDGTRVLQTGDVVHVDGTAGIVTMLEREAIARAT